jgi:hypothetical protein
LTLLNLISRSIEIDWMKTIRINSELSRGNHFLSFLREF